MQNPHTYGSPSYRIALIHGGPGSVGEMQPVAEELGNKFSILEPLQTADTLTGQVEELAGILRGYSEPPLTLAGFSWGAWLSWITAATHPELVRKLILIGSGPFTEEYAQQITFNRLQNMSRSDKAEYITLLEVLSDPFTTDHDRLFARLGELAAKADHYDPIEPTDNLSIEDNPYYAVLDEAMGMRETGELLALGNAIQCPVVAIHGENDPHPIADVEVPLQQILNDFRMIALPECGHKPWIERQARENFFKHLRIELRN